MAMLFKMMLPSIPFPELAWFWDSIKVTDKESIISLSQSMTVGKGTALSRPSSMLKHLTNELLIFYIRTSIVDNNVVFFLNMWKSVHI